MTKRITVNNAINILTNRVAWLEKRLAEVKTSGGTPDRIEKELLAVELAIRTLDHLRPENFAIHASELETTWHRVLDVVNNYLPNRGHEGSCGPEAGCDALCMEVASVSETIWKHQTAIRKVVRKLHISSPRDSENIPKGKPPLTETDSVKRFRK